MKLALFTLGAVLLAVPAFAQHPCDNLSPAAVALKSPVSAGVCWSQKDEDGNPAVATKLHVFNGAIEVATVTNPTPTGAANAAGLFFYQVPGVAVSKPSAALTFTVETVDGVSDASTAFTFPVKGGKPAKPVGPRAQ